MLAEYESLQHVCSFGLGMGFRASCYTAAGIGGFAFMGTACGIVYPVFCFDWQHLPSMIPTFASSPAFFCFDCESGSGRSLSLMETYLRLRISYEWNTLNTQLFSQVPENSMFQDA